MKNVHIGYGDSATGCLQEAIDQFGLPGDSAIPSRDDFTQGPISEVLKPRGLVQRIEYWRAVDQALGFRFEPEEFYRNSIQILDDVNTEEITLWVGDSCHDILATGWLISYLKEKPFEWYVVDLSEAAKSHPPHKLPAVNLAMYRPGDVTELYRFRRPMAQADFQFYLSTWTKAASENSPYRIKEGDQIVSVDKDYYDEFILSFIPEHFESTRSIIGAILQDGSRGISDTTVEWNIRKLIDNSTLEYEGHLEDMESYNIRKKV